MRRTALSACLGVQLVVVPVSFAAPSGLARITAELSSKDTARRARAARELALLGRGNVRELLRRALDDDELDVRIAALQAAGELAEPDSVPQLLHAATGAEARVREAAVKALGAQRPQRAISATLTRALADAELPVRMAALSALATRGLEPLPGDRSAVLEGIAACLTDERPELRRAAAETFERLGDRFAVPALVGRIDDPSPEVRLAIARALGALGDPRAASAVLRLVDDSTDEVRAAAIATLGLLAADSAVPRLVPLLDRPRDPLAGPAAVALGRIAAARTDDPVSATLRRRAGDALAAAARGDRNRSAAFEGLRLCGPAAAPLLATLLPALGPRPSDEALLVAGELAADGDPTVTRLLLDLARLASDGRFDAALVRARPPLGPTREALVVWLAARLGDPGAAARRAAATALGELGDTRASAPLQAALSDSDTTVRRDALLALVRTSQAREPELLHAARDGDPAVARAGIVALGHRHDDSARAALVAAIDAPDVALAFSAALALSDDRDAGVVTSPLLAVVKRGPERAREPATLALQGPLRSRPNAIARELCLPLVATDQPGGAGALELLGAMRDAASAERLVRLLPKLARRPLRRARLHAVLGDMALAGDDAVAERALVAALSDADAGVRLSAAWALGKVKPGTAGTDRELAAHLADPIAGVRVNALAAMARRRQPVSSETLESLARDPEKGVRANAIRLGASHREGNEGDDVLATRAIAHRSAPPNPRGGDDYLTLHLARPSTVLRVGLPDGLIAVFLADDRGIVRDEGVPSGELEVEVDDTLLR